MTLQLPQDAAVVLDVDDTLYLERNYVKSGFDAVGEHLRRHHGLEGGAETMWWGFVQGVRGSSFDRLLEVHGRAADDGLIAELVECYRSHRPDIQLLPDAVRFLARLGGRATALITDGPSVSQRAKVEALGLIERVDRLVLTDDLGVGVGKPDPTAYLLVERDLGVPPDRCWYIGDNPRKDFVTPLARGWTSIRVRRRRSLHDELPTPPGVHEIESLDELES